MDMSKRNVNSTTNLAEMRTWQSGILQTAVHRNIKRISDEYLKQYDLTTMHWFIIGAIIDGGPNGVRLTDLAERVGTTSSYLTTALNSLELKEMIVRDDHKTDSRTKMITISPAFMPESEKIEEGMRDIFRAELYKKISRDELSVYISVLQKLNND